MKEYFKKNQNKLVFILINICVFTAMLAINTFYPLCWDDKGFVEKFDPNNWTIKDVFIDSYYRYYLHWSGKLLPLSLATLFTLLDKTIYNIINSFMYIVFANTIYRFFWKKKYDCWILLAVYVALWLCIPWYGTVVFWIDGTVEYLWMFIPVLVIGSIYFNSYFNIEQKKISSIGIFLLGLLAGCGLEATISALIFGLGVMMISKVIRKQRLLSWEISGLVGILIGFAFLMLAPGNYERARTVTETASRHSNIIYRFGRETFFSLLYLTPLVGIFVGLTVLLFRCRKTDENAGQKIENRFLYIYQTCKEPIALAVIAMASIYVMTFTSAFAVRIFMTPTVLLIIACGISLKGIAETSLGQSLLEQFSLIIRILLIFACIFVLVQMLMAFISCLYTGNPVTMNIQYTNTINDVRLFD